jgi:hypothetical protein
MSEKHKSTTPGPIKVKNWHKTINTEKKLDVTSQHEKGEQIFDKCCNVQKN